MAISITCVSMVAITGDIVNTIQFETVMAKELRITVNHPVKQLALVELEYY